MSVAMDRMASKKQEPSLAESRTRFAWLGGLLFGFGTQLLFLYTVVYLFLFLRYGGNGGFASWWVVDTLLAIGFAVPHSILLAPSIQRWTKTWLPAGLLGCLHCTVTCLTLLGLFHCWGRSETVIWNASGYSQVVILSCFYGSWLALFYSLWLTGLGYQTGLTQWWYWLHAQSPPRREFVVSGAYRWMRHPVYVSFLGLIWFTPSMTLDHLILSLVWTAYIYAGSYFKDRRLLRFIGPSYEDYARRVVGFPLIGIGSLRRFH